MEREYQGQTRRSTGEMNENSFNETRQTKLGLVFSLVRSTTSLPLVLPLLFKNIANVDGSCQIYAVNIVKASYYKTLVLVSYRSSMVKAAHRHTGSIPTGRGPTGY